MQLYNFLSIGFVATLASIANAEQAHGYARAHYLDRRQQYGAYDNETTSATSVAVTSPSVTSTLCSTVVETITHCPKYVKDCPAESTETRTRTIPIGVSSYPAVTTSSDVSPSGYDSSSVHPSSEYGYSSVYSPISSSSSPSGYKPSSASSGTLTNPVDTTSATATKPVETSSDKKKTTKSMEISSDEKTTTVTIDSTVTRFTTVVLTTGKGDDKTVLTTTLPITDTKYNTHTVTDKRPSDVSPSTAKSSDSRPTTTISSTSTTTRIVTVYPKSSSATGDNKPSVYGENKPSSATETDAVPTGGEPTCKPSKVTVTETEKETIYVTVTPKAPTTTSSTAIAPVTSESSSTKETHKPYQSSSPYYPNPSNTEKTTSAGTGLPSYTSSSSSSSLAEATMSSYSPRYPPSYGVRR